MVWVFNYTDCAGNSHDWSYTYTISDPVWTMPANTTDIVACAADIVIPTPPEIIDNCGRTIIPLANPLPETAICNGDMIYAWTYTDCSGNSNVWTHTVTVNDDINPTITDCPGSQTIPADWEETYGTVPLNDPLIADNCTETEDLTLNWTMTGATPGNGSGNIPSPYQFNIGATTVRYTVIDACGNEASCQFIIVITAKPVIECAPPATLYSPVDDCSVSFDPGVPTLLDGAEPITWTWTITELDGTVQASGGSITPDDGPTPLPVTPNPYDFDEGLTIITWAARNFSGEDICVQEILVLDTVPPTFTSAPYQDCVDKLYSVTYDPTNPNPLVNHIDPNLDKVPSPDYSTFEAGNKALDLTDVDDNCCDSEELIINWRIDFSDVPDPINAGVNISHSPITGIGQPSEHLNDILLWGDGVNFTIVTHTITYWVEDCNGNISDEQTAEITVTPRPRILKLN
jgi:hypothetical protein